MKHYPHHISDFNNATRHLSRSERSLYRDLVELYYETEKPLPLDVLALCRRILANECSTDVERLLNEFFVETPTGWYHDRCEEEIGKYQANNSQRARAGKASAAKKALKKQQALNGESTSVEIPLNDTSTEKQNQSTNQPINQLLPTVVKSASAPTIPELSDSLMADFLKVRKAKGAPLTETAIAGIRREADKAGLSMVEAITECVECNWQGFRADWHTERKSRTKTNGNTPASQHKFSAAAKTIYGYENNERTIDV